MHNINFQYSLELDYIVPRVNLRGSALRADSKQSSAVAFMDSLLKK
jgi:hypothetical protein